MASDGKNSAERFWSDWAWTSLKTDITVTQPIKAIALQFAEAYRDSELAAARKEIERLHVALCQACERMNQGDFQKAHEIVRSVLE